MKLLVVGGTKFIGRAVVERALELGHDVAIFHRGETEPEDLADVLHIHGDNLAIADHIDEIKAFGADAVVDTTQFEADRTQAVVEALAGVVDRYVLVCSKDVYLAYGRLHRTEPGPHQAVPLTEESELRTLPGFGHTEEIDNLYIEKVALGQDELPVTITRLPGVFGPRDYQRRIGVLIDKLEGSDGVVKLYPTMANFHWTWGYVFNIADMLIECALDRREGNHIYNLGFEMSLSYMEIHQLVADLLGWEGEIVATEDGLEVPTPDYTQQWNSDSSKFRRDFGYTDRIPMKEAFRLTIESAKRSGSDEHD
jgi:nucleoside-diphosphate-sugar epimerase